jgi:putative transposase
VVFFANTVADFAKRLEEAEIVPSMERAGSALDNAISMRFVSKLKCELLHRHRFSSRESARSIVFEYQEAFYNRRRLHSSLVYLSSESCEDPKTKQEVTVA